MLYCYGRYAKREMKAEMELQISSVMSQYFALSDTSTKEKSAAVTINP